MDDQTGQFAAGPRPGVSDSEARTVLSPHQAAGAPAFASQRLSVGDTLGPYRIGRLLGRGGMGEVYEAEHLEHERRIALKVLNRQLAGAEDRERFLREGQLAAAISHPHSVYIFGSEDIGGTPVIAMELVPGGTLKDRVERDGPLAPAAAVDAILDVIAGLDAAHAAGVLHRDVKPSNCFVDPDGGVKVGDFGLSIPVLARGETPLGGNGLFEGTPQFAAPEQIAGEALDVRADIYAVGATLHYLVTGRPPFDDGDLTTLIERVRREAPVSARARNPRVPRGLAAVILRALAKDRADRFSDYATLSDALRPFGSAAPTPATLGLRLVAGVVDRLLITGLTAPIALSPVIQLTLPATVNFSVKYSGAGNAETSAAATLAICLVTVLYYWVQEGFSRASIGKRLCGLQVVGPGGGPAGPVRAAARTLVFLLPLWWTIADGAFDFDGAMAGPDASRAVQADWAWAFVGVGWIATWITFASIRRRNGYAAWHDLISGTRVIVARGRNDRVPLVVADRPGGVAAAGERAGPYALVQRLGETGDGTLWLAHDAVLQRTVWIHRLPPGRPALAPARRDLARPGRLRWLAGRRADDEAWDAYEAPDGAPLAALAGPRGWPVVKHWIHDLSREIEAASADGTLPVLAVDRVWITRDSRARLLDFAAPGAVGPRPGESPEAPQAFLAALAARVLPPNPVPLSARTMLATLDRGGYASARDIVSHAARAAAGLDSVSRWRRGVSLALANVPLLFMAAALLTLLPTALHVLPARFLAPTNCLLEIAKLEGRTDAQAVRQREALEIVAATRHRATLAAESFWADRRSRDLLAPLRPLADRALRDRANVPADLVVAAAVEAAPLLADSRAAERTRTAILVMLVFPAAALLASGLVALVSAFVGRGGLLLRLLGLAVVGRDGGEVSRVRALARAAVAWSPIFLLAAYAAATGLLARLGSPGSGLDAVLVPYAAFAGAFGALAAGAAAAIIRPERGWADRILGTWIVPR
jgi:hypothetical protein